MEENNISEKDLHDYLHALWFRALREAPQGLVLELCSEAKLKNTEIQHVAQFRAILRQQQDELEELQEAVRESDRVMASPIVARANAIARQKIDERRPSFMRRLGRKIGKLKSFW